MENLDEKPRGSSPARVGITFLDSNNVAQSMFRFTGGESAYKIDDSVTDSNTGIGFTDNGFNVKLSLNNSSGNYTLMVGSNTFASRTLAQGTSTIAAVRVFNIGAGSGSTNDVFFNNLTISAVPEVSPALAIPVAVIISGLAGAIAHRKSRRKTSSRV